MPIRRKKAAPGTDEVPNAATEKKTVEIEVIIEELEGNFNPRSPNATVEVDGVDLFIEDVVDAGEKAGLFIEFTVDDEVEGLIVVGFMGVAFVVIMDPLFPNRGIPAGLLVIVVGKLPGRDVVGNAVDAVSRCFCRCRCRFVAGRRPVAGQFRIPAVGQFAA